MRILFLDYTNRIGIGGGQRSLALLLRHLPRNTYQPLAACPPGEMLRAILPEDVPVFDLALPDGFSSLSRGQAGWLSVTKALTGIGGTVTSLRSLVIQQRVDLIHANNLKMLVLAAAATRGLKVPVLWHVRDIFPESTAGLLGLAARTAHRVLTVSRAVANQFQRDSRKLSVVYNAVELPDLNRAKPAKVRPVTIGYVGRLDAGKGLDDLVSAFISLSRRRRPIRLLLAGDGPEAARIPNLPGIVKLGYQQDLEAAWGQIDICVQPSNQPDSFPRAVIEAMGWGKPVVGARIGGIPEAINDGNTGFLFRPGDPEDLAAKLAVVLDEPRLAEAMGAAGRLRCERSFSIGAQIRQLAPIYEDAYALCNS